MNDQKVVGAGGDVQAFLKQWLSEKQAQDDDKINKSMRHFKRTIGGSQAVKIPSKSRSFTVIVRDEAKARRGRSVSENQEIAANSLSWIFGKSPDKEPAHIGLLQRKKQSASVDDVGKVLEEGPLVKKKRAFSQVFGEILRTESAFYLQLRLITREVQGVTIADYLKENGAISEENYQVLQQYETLARELRECSKVFISALRKDEKTEEEKLLDGFSVGVMKPYLDAVCHYITIYEQEMELFPKMVSDPTYKKKYEQIGSDLQKITKSNLDLASFFITPIQRVPRLILLLRELDKFGSEEIKRGLCKILAFIKRELGSVGSSKRELNKHQIQLLLRIEEDVEESLILQKSVLEVLSKQGRDIVRKKRIQFLVEWKSLPKQTSKEKKQKLRETYASFMQGDTIKQLKRKKGESFSFDKWVKMSEEAAFGAVKAYKLKAKKPVQFRQKCYAKIVVNPKAFLKLKNYLIFTGRGHYVRAIREINTFASMKSVPNRLLTKIRAIKLMYLQEDSRMKLEIERREEHLIFADLILGHLAKGEDASTFIPQFCEKLERAIGVYIHTHVLKKLS